MNKKLKNNLTPWMFIVWLVNISVIGMFAGVGMFMFMVMGGIGAFDSLLFSYFYSCCLSISLSVVIFSIFKDKSNKEVKNGK